jgi:hypothetical protein
MAAIEVAGARSSDPMSSEPSWRVLHLFRRPSYERNDAWDVTFSVEVGSSSASSGQRR